MTFPLCSFPHFVMFCLIFCLLNHTSLLCPYCPCIVHSFTCCAHAAAMCGSYALFGASRCSADSWQLASLQVRTLVNAEFNNTQGVVRISIRHPHRRHESVCVFAHWSRFCRMQLGRSTGLMHRYPSPIAGCCSRLLRPTEPLTSVVPGIVPGAVSNKAASPLTKGTPLRT